MWTARRVGPVLVAAAVLVAGCNVPGAVPGSASTPEATPTPSEATATADTPSPTSERARPGDIGLSPDGVSDPVQLARMHGLRLAGQSFEYTDRTTVRSANGSVLYDRTLRARVDDTHNTYETVRTSRVDDDAPAWALRPYPTEPPRTDVYSNSTMAVERVQRENGTLTRMRRASGAQSPRLRLSGNRYVAKSTIVLLFSEVNAPITDVRIENGTTLYVMSTDEGRYHHGYTFPNWGGTTGSVTSFRAVVDEYGLVREVRLRYAVENEGTTVEVTRRIAFTGVGSTTVRRGEWVDAAVAQPDEVLPEEANATDSPLLGSGV